MTIDETVQMFNAIDAEDTEMAHAQAEQLMLRFLDENGYGELVTAWNTLVTKCGGYWYG